MEQIPLVMCMSVRSFEVKVSLISSTELCVNLMTQFFSSST